jgi:hypothetical protein
MEPADTATYGRAKERTGKATSSALKGLRETLASRGLLGSGIEASETGKVFSSGLSDLAETNRQMAEQGAAREFTARESGKNREFSAAQEGLRAAMVEPDTAMGSPGDPYGTKAAARMQAIFEAKQQIRQLTGYSMPSGGAGMY